MELTVGDAWQFDSGQTDLLMDILQLLSDVLEADLRMLLVDLDLVFEVSQHGLYFSTTFLYFLLYFCCQMGCLDNLIVFCALYLDNRVFALL